MKNRLALCYLLVIGILLFTTPSLAVDINRTSIGVQEGDTFNMKVVEDTLNLAQLDPLGISLTELVGDELSELVLDNLGISISDGVENLILDEGDVFTVKVDTLPSEDSQTLGKIELTFQGVSEVVTTDFFLGTPVTFTDWDGWVEILDNITATVNDFNDTTAATVSRIHLNNNTHFGNKISVTFPLPEGVTTVTGINLVQDMLYDKTTGILLFLSINLEVSLDLGGTSSKLSQTYEIEKTDDSTSDESSETSSTNDGDESNPVPGFEFIVILVSLGTLAILFKKSKSRDP